jgi:hypothetical protein
MPVKRFGPDAPARDVRRDLAEQLAAELKRSQDHGQPVIFERLFRTGKASVTVIWDAWHGLPLQERTATILRAYELAESPSALDRIALATGLTVPEAYATGMLPYEIIPAVRKGDPVTPEEIEHALREEGASQLVNPPALQLRFATQEEAEAAVRRLVQRLPKSEPIWIIHREIIAQDSGQGQEWAQAREE